jgi:hypothetical protein
LRRRRTYQAVLILALAAAPLAAPAASQAADETTRCDIAVQSESSSVGTRTITHDLGTGEQNLVRDAYGTVDTKWRVVAPTAGPAYSVAPNAAWVDVPGHNWINVRNTNASSGGTAVVSLDTDVALPTGVVADTATIDLEPIAVGTTTATFRTTFVLPAQSFLERLNLTYAADNGVRFKLNGIDIGGFSPTTASATAFNQLHTLAYAGPLLRAGTNNLDAIVTDYGVSTGLVVSGGYDGCAVDYVEPGVCISTSDTGVTTWAARRISLNTGAHGSVRDAYGAVDSKWTTVSPTPGPAYSVAPYPGWYDDSTVANWIHRTADPRTGGGGVIGEYGDLVATLTEAGVSSSSSGIADVQAGLPDVGGTTAAAVQTYTYQVTFNVPSGVSYRDLDLRYAADNAVAFFLNGTPIGGITGGTTNHTPFNQLHPLLWNGAGFRAGSNTLTAVVTDYGVASGLLVEGAARVCETPFIRTDGTALSGL